MKREDYPYLYETHIHTSESSACAGNSGEEMARACKEAGYTGIIITDHNWYGNSCIDRSLPWEQWVEVFCRGYENAKKWGDENGLQVFFGYESCYRGTEFLIYGVDGQWLVDHPEIKDASIEEQYRLIHEAGGMVIQAHPFRKEDYIPEIRLFPEWTDGAEGINATHSCHLSKNHNDPEWDNQAIAYSLQHNLPMTAGSDVHSTLIFGGGVAFKRRLKSIRDYCDAILSGEDYILTNGDEWFDKKGEKI
ncbi:MAG: PHP domain-containing protein [Suilimivivens sp.]